MFASSSRRVVTLILILGFTAAITGCNSESRKEENSKPVKTGDATKAGATKENPGNNKSPANQAPVTAGNSTAHPYVTNDCQAAIILHPRKIYQSVLLEKLLESGAIKTFVDNELVGQLINTLGFDVREITRFSLLVTSLPSQPREEPSLVMVLEFTEAEDRSKIISDLMQLDAPVEQDGKQWYLRKDARSGPIVCVPNNKTVVFSTDLDLAKQVVTMPAAKNPLNARLVELDYQNQAGVIVGKRDLFPPALMAEIQGGVRREGLPPAFAEVTAIMAELKAASMVLNLSPDLYLELGVTTSSEENTTKLRTMINDSLTLLKSTLGVLTLVPPKDMPKAMRPVLQETLKLLAQIELRQSKSRLAVIVKVPPRQLMALQGPLEQFLVSLVAKTPKIPDLHLVQGKVTLDGKPLAGARVALHRIESGASRVFAATTNTEGFYNIQALYTSGEFSGARAGRYKVTVIKVSPSELSDEEFDRKYQQQIEATTIEAKPVARPAPAYLVNPQYVSVLTTPFEVEVRADAPIVLDGDSEERINVHNFSLTSEPPLKK
ncbi:MAG: carboxypeptidase-like regulatory domain-containing protein [Pirellulaceae bacterium]